MRTRIDLGSSGSIDLFEDVPMSLNYSIADIRNPDKRNASFSKTISIPGSKTNDKIFGHIFEIGIDGSFNPNIKTPAIIYVDELEQLKGFLQLLKIKRNENKVIYECSIIGNVGNMFTTLADSLLNELDLSEYDHVYNKATQKASWTATVGQGYLYPMINYGITNGLAYDVANFYPAIYLKQYIDKIFDYAGYTYTSNFFNSDFFKRLIIPFNGNKIGLTQAQIDERVFSASLTVTQTWTITNFASAAEGMYNRKVQFNNEISDPSFQYDPSTYVFTVLKAGYYNFEASVTATCATAAVNQASSSIFLIRKPFDPIAIGAPFYPDATPATGYVSATSVFMSAGETMYVTVDDNGGTATGKSMSITSGSFTCSIANPFVIDGDDLVLSKAIPDKIKQKELLLAVIKKYNLYIETDKDHDNKLYIEPRNDFYSSGVTVDLTDKQDVSLDIEISPMGDLTSRKYNFTYTEDKDYYNDLYKKSYNEPYGSRLIDTGNEFITGTNETKILFSSTPLVDSNSHDRVLSYISEASMGNTVNLKAFNIRLLYYGGVKNTANPWTYTSTISGTTTETTYPYAGHLDDPANPTLDLNFGVPFEVYYRAIKYTNNNTYNRFHKQFLEEITDPDSKTVTGYFHLTPVDIMSLDFRNQFVVQGHYLRLNKIVDHNPISGAPTKCEFIKIKNITPFTPQVLDRTNGVGSDSPFNGTE